MIRLNVVHLRECVFHFVLGEVLVPFDVRPFELVDVLHFVGYLPSDDV